MPVCVKGVKRDKNKCVRGENKVGPLGAVVINLLCENMYFFILLTVNDLVNGVNNRNNGLKSPLAFTS